MELCNSIMASRHGCKAQQRVVAFLSWGAGVVVYRWGRGENSHHVLAHNSGSKPPMDMRTGAKEAPEHDLSDGSGPGAVGAHRV